MKKTTKKLISIFLSLLMVLSLIPMGTMSAYAAEWTKVTIQGQDLWYKAPASYDNNSSIEGILCLDDSIFYVWDKDESDWDYRQTCDHIKTTDPTCGKCLTCGHDASQHEDGECYDCGIRDACFRYGSDKREFCVLDAGHTGPCSATLPKTYDGTDNWGIYYKSSFTVESPKLCQSSSFALGDVFNNVQNRAPSATVYCDGVVVAKASYVSGTVVKVDSDKLYICTNHTGSYGTLCETCTVPTGPQKMGETNTYWELEDGVLTISGTGATPDYSYQNPTPWNDKKDDITSVVIESEVTAIGKYFANGCSKLASVTIPNSVTTIGEAAFMNCKALASITLPNNLTTIGKNAFNGVGITSVSIPNTVTSIGNGAFMDCGSLASVTLPTGITEIAGYTFAKCGSLTSIKIPNGVTSIGGSAFSLCGNLTSITLPSGVTSIGTYAFEECEKLAKVTLSSSGLVSIGAGAFTHCSALTNFTFPSTVTTIGGSAFGNCSSLTNITLPSTVTSIGNRAFEKCSKLASVVVNAKAVPTLGSSAFKDCASDLVIYVPSESVADYKTNWATYEDKIEAIKTSAPSFPAEEEKQEETTPAPVTEETSVTKVIVPSKSKIKVTVNKVDGVDGYQIQYGRVKSFKKSKKTITTKKTVKTIKVKKPGKKYYVRVRSFKIVDGKKVYSNWSKIMSIKTK